MGMSTEHKEALAEGRTLGRAVRRYLEAMESHRPRRGRRLTEESVAEKLEKSEAKLANGVFDGDPVGRLHEIQNRLDLENQLARFQESEDLSDLEAEFIEAAPRYSAAKGITYVAWRELGVPAPVLKQAGIRRGGVPVG